MALPLLTGLIDQHGETLQQAALLAYLKQGEEAQPMLEAITTARLCNNVMKSLSKEDQYEAARTETTLRIAKWIKEHPRATQIYIKMNGYPIFLLQCKEEFKKRFPEDPVPGELAVKCIERWKNMSDREKKWFNHLSIINSPSPTKQESAKRPRKTKRPKDPNAPKRALSGFFWFSNEHRGKIKDANPDFGVGDIAKELGKMWAECDEATKSKYEEMAEKDRIRYDKEKTAYQLKQKEDGAPQPDFYDEDAD